MIVAEVVMAKQMTLNADGPHSAEYTKDVAPPWLPYQQPCLMIKTMIKRMIKMMICSVIRNSLLVDGFTTDVCSSQSSAVVRPPTHLGGTSVTPVNPALL
jgi:hypothetical protein